MGPAESGEYFIAGPASQVLEGCMAFSVDYSTRETSLQES